MLAVSIWVLLVLGLYPYLIYPALIWVCGAVRARVVRVDVSYQPMLTVVTAAFNEAANIEATIRNKLEEDYPGDRLQVVVVSDGSTDGTDSLVARLAEQDARVCLVRQEPRQGKTSALNRALQVATGDVVLFADANSMYRRGALRAIAANFADPSVGYVTGRMQYVSANGSVIGDGCTAYMRYENALRVAETRAGSIVGADGGIDAVRRELYRPMRPEQLPDFVLPLDVVRQGYRVVFEPNAILTEEALGTPAAEYQMRVRVSLRALWALWDSRDLLNPWRYPLFSWQLWSHKVLRYGSFGFLAAGSVLVWLMLQYSPLYQLLAILQVVFVGCVLLGARGPAFLRRWKLVRNCFYFFVLNVAAGVAFWKFLLGEIRVTWSPRAG